jgi:glycosyltransferase involved in cell wall biosynthesis
MSKKVTVITPTTGSDYLKQNANSVAKQTYENVEHLIVIDGTEFADKAYRQLDLETSPTFLTLPYNTGHSQYNGHRIYGSVC